MPTLKHKKCKNKCKNKDENKRKNKCKNEVIIMQKINNNWYRNEYVIVNDKR